MKTRSRFLIALALCLTVLPATALSAPLRPARSGRPLPIVSQKSRHVAFWACSDGRGVISLFWLPSGGEWPVGGFRIERIVKGKSTVLAPKIFPGQDPGALAALPTGEAEWIRQLAEKIADGSLTDEDRRLSIIEMGRYATTNVPYGIALGVRYQDAMKGAGKVTYKLITLGAEGETVYSVDSNEVDPSKRTPGPVDPRELRAEARIDSVALYWADPPADAVIPVVAYEVERVVVAGKKPAPVRLTKEPLILDRHLRPGQPDFLDEEAPRNNLVYEVRSMDIFGRVGNPVRAKVAVADFPVLPPPSDLVAEVQPKSVLLTWKTMDNETVDGYIVERSAHRGGPYRVLTKAGLPRATDRYEDKDIQEGRDYFYRLRSRTRRGDVGAPSNMVLARSLSSGGKTTSASAEDDSRDTPFTTSDVIEEETVVAPPAEEAPVASSDRQEKTTKTEGHPPPAADKAAAAAAPPAAPAPAATATAPATPPAAPATTATAPPATAATDNAATAAAPSSTPAPAATAPAATAAAPATPPAAPATTATAPPAATATDNAATAAAPSSTPAPAATAPAATAPAATASATPPAAPAATATAPPAATATDNAATVASIPPKPAPAGAAAAAGAPASEPPPVPVIVSILGHDGKVTILLQPGDPEDRTAEFLVFRSSTPGSEGVPVGRPLPAATREWQDTSAESGKSFWYRLVAVDKDGRRSPPSSPKWVRIPNR